MNKKRKIIEEFKKNIEINIKHKLWFIVKEDIISFYGVIYYALKCNIIDEKEWKKYAEFCKEIRQKADIELINDIKN